MGLQELSSGLAKWSGCVQTPEPDVGLPWVGALTHLAERRKQRASIV